MKKTRKTIFGTLIRLLCLISLIWICTPEPIDAAGLCGTGTWQLGNLEIHHIDIGQGDSTLIVGPTGKSLLFDAGESSWNSSAKAKIIGPYIESVLGCKSLDYVVISHFHVDHVGYVGYGGLWDLVEIQGFTIGTTIVRDYNAYLGDTSGTLTNWKTYLEGSGRTKLHPVFAGQGPGQVNLGTGVVFDIITVNGNSSIIAGDFHGDANPPSENDYSIGVVLRYGNFDEWIGGDLDGEYETSGFGYSYHDIETSAARELGDIDVYRVNHHGSSHSSNNTFINQLDPEVSIISVGSGNGYGHPTQPVMDRLLATSIVYMTERGDTNTTIGSAIVAGTIVIKTSNGSTYTVNGTLYTATNPVRIDADGDGYFAEVDPNDANPGTIPTSNGGCDSLYQTCSTSSFTCQVVPGQLLINEVLPAPSSNGAEWIELYNATANTLNIGYCYVDDIAGGSAPYQIPAMSLISAHGFWTLDRTSYFNNTGDDVRLLKEDGNTVLDSYTYGSTSYDVSWYRLPDGGPWAISPTASTTKGQTNTLPFYPIVLSSVLADENPSSANSVSFIVSFSKVVTGVNLNAPFIDFALSVTGITGASISNVSGSGTTYTVTVNTGSGDGTIRLDVLDDDSIRDSQNHPLGGTGNNNGNFTSGATYTITKLADVNVTIGGNSAGNYSMPRSSNLRVNYAGLDSGPVKVISTNNVPIISALRDLWWNGSAYTSSIQLMGLPQSLLSDTYVFPSYNNVNLNDQLRFGNVGNADTVVTVTIGGVVMGNYPLAPNQRQKVNYAGLDSGPVIVKSSNGVPIIASIRDAWINNGVTSSFSQLMGLPQSLLSDTYVFPSYNNISLSDQLRFGNVGNAPTTVTITIGGVVMGNYDLLPNQRDKASYPGLDSGPVIVHSSNGVPIIASLREAWLNNGVTTSYFQMMGLPQSQLSDKYVFPAYDNVTLSGQLRFGNVGNTNTTVTVTIAGVVKGTYDLAPNQRQKVSYVGLDDGPMVVQSSNGVPIIAALRDAWLVNGVTMSFSQLMGLPGSQLSTVYVFPSYNNVTYDNQLRIGVP